MTSIKDVINVVVAIALLSFIGLSLVRLGVFFLQNHQLI